MAALLSSPLLQVACSFLRKVICEPMQPHDNLQGKGMRLKRGRRFGFRVPLLSRNKRHGEASAVAKRVFEWQSRSLFGQVAFHETLEAVFATSDRVGRTCG